MGTILILSAVIQAALHVQAPGLAERPRFAAGLDVGGGVIAAVQGGRGAIVGAGPRVTVPLGGRYAFDARALHGLLNPGGGIYELRVRRDVDWRGRVKPDYAGVGAVGYYALDTGLYGKLKPRIGHVSRPLTVSLVAGWENRRGPRRAVPVEVSLLAHPYGLFAASITLGATWSTAAPARAVARTPPR